MLNNAASMRNDLFNLDIEIEFTWSNYSKPSKILIIKSMVILMIDKNLACYAGNCHAIQIKY